MVVRTLKALLIRDIIHEQYPHRTSIIRRRDRPETFLSRRIPYLQLHPLAVQLDGADLEIDPDRSDERGRETVFAESEQAAGLAYARIAYEEELDLWMVVSADCRHGRIMLQGWKRRIARGPWTERPSQS